ncbi:MAG: molybdopterin-dependent oxidoreductase [Alphaproteobacteria bacterium]|nr:molybdopterin-dependent oxidoreductase [Alphaproteobacteria bacterium]
MRCERAMTMAFTLNGKTVRVSARPVARLSDVVREELGATGTKVGCDAGDCGACTVLLDGKPVCACMVPVGRMGGRHVETVEGMAKDGALNRLQRSFLHYGAIQCGICIPGMLMAATALLRANPAPSEAEVREALGGVLCRCTGYRKIIRAVREAHRFDAPVITVQKGMAVGGRVRRVDGVPKVTGADLFAADEAPTGALVIKVVRCPHNRARFTIGDLDGFVRDHPGVVRVFTAADIPGENRFGVIPAFAEQPVFARQACRFRGEAVAMVVGERQAMAELPLADFPVTWEPLPDLMSVQAATAPGAPQMFEDRKDNILISGLVRRGDVDAGLDGAAIVVEGTFETAFVEHAYIEPEAGYAVRVGDRVEVHVCTQSPYLDRDDVARILGLADEAVRIVPTSVGGAFGSKLDLSVQPFLALAAWALNRPVRMTYSRPESMMCTTKRHPSRITIKLGADKNGKLAALDYLGIFNTGAYASWGPTVANRVPVHASGPYVIPDYLARSRAVHTNGPPAGAFRGFGVPQTTLAQEVLFDELAEKLTLDRLEFRLLNALDNGVPTVTGQVFATGVGFRQCLEALKPHWQRACADAERHNKAGNGSHRQGHRRGVGLAGMWYGCGNTSLPNPSTLKVGIAADGRVVLFQGAVDIGQGANTVMTQICADAVGLPMDCFELVVGDTDLTADAGKTSASRQTFVSGKAAFLAGQDLRRNILALSNAADTADIELTASRLTIRDGEAERIIDLSALDIDDAGFVLWGEGTFDPPTSALDENGQGEPYATFGYGAHMVELDVDTALGLVKVLKVTAAHDVGRAINPTLVEGQVEGGVAQGLGMALMEDYVPGRSENLHDYLIPTIGDVPEIETILIEQADPLGPYGAKGIGEQALIPTAPAVLNAIRHATGARLRAIPATPERIRRAILEAGQETGEMR